MAGREAPGWSALRADRTLRRIGEGVWVGGSPMVMFRVTEAGDELIGRLVGTSDVAGLGANGRVARSLLDRLVLAGAAHPVPTPSAEAPAAADVTVVVPVRNRTDGLDRLLSSLRDEREPASSGDPGTRVVVVDDASGDPAAVSSTAAAHGAELLRMESPLGPAGARNAGLAEVRTTLVAFVDSDVVVRRGWLDALLAQLADHRVAMVAPRVASAAGPGLLARYEQTHSPLDLGADPAAVRPGGRVSYLPAAALLARTEVMGSLGGFDESMPTGEDVDLVWRTVAAGHVVRYEPASVVEHDPRPTLGEWLRQRRSYGASAVALDDRHPGTVAPVVCSGWSAAAWALASLGHPVLGTALAGGSAVALTTRLGGVPALNAASLAASGHLAAGRQLARAVVRPWWPAALAGSLVSGRVRRCVAAAVVLDLANRSGRPWERALSLLDDGAYGAGVWEAALRTRRFRALAPAFSRWP